MELGGDFRGPLTTQLYRPSNPAGLGFAIGFAVLLVLANQLLQAGFGLLSLTAIVGGSPGDARQVVKSFMVGILPASLATAGLALLLAGFRGGQVKEVLALRWPDLSVAGWAVVIGVFLAGMYGAILVIVAALGIDLAQYTPGADGKSPDTGSAGLVKEAMFDIANEPRLFILVLLSVAIGAPLAEELVFRGQLFAALSQTVGVWGATLVTSLAWALLHATEPWLSIGLIFVMGLVLGFLLIRFGSLWVTIICHGVWNSIYSLMIFWGIEG
jgi:CAAX protease family protein